MIKIHFAFAFYLSKNAYMWLTFYFTNLSNLFRMRQLISSALKQDTISSAKGMESLKRG